MQVFLGSHGIGFALFRGLLWLVLHANCLTAIWWKNSNEYLGRYCLYKIDWLSPSIADEDEAAAAAGLLSVRDVYDWNTYTNTPDEPEDEALLIGGERSADVDSIKRRRSSLAVQISAITRTRLTLYRYLSFTSPYKSSDTLHRRLRIDTTMTSSSKYLKILHAGIHLLRKKCCSCCHFSNKIVLWGENILHFLETLQCTIIGST